MGEFTDDLMFEGLDAELKWEQYNSHYNNIHYTALLREYFKEDLLWCKKDGNNVLIQDMTDSHLQNSISWIEKLGNECTESLLEMKTILIIEKNKRKSLKLN
jgi:hypothetical protein